MPLTVHDNTATDAPQVGRWPAVDDPALARRVEDELHTQGLRRVLVDPTVLRRLAGLLIGPDEEAERARRRDAAERELAGMELHWTRSERRDRPERLSGRHAPAGGGEAKP
jgi:hypothetical protein